MQRKKFITTTLATLPLLAFSQLQVKTKNNNKPFVVRNGESRLGKNMKYKGVHPNDVLISKKDTGDALSVFVFTGFGKIGPSFHVHYYQDELFYIVEGTYRFVVAEETIEAGTGDTVFLPRNIPHSWIQLTEKGKMLYAVQPAGSMEEFFTEMNDLKKPPTEEEAQNMHLKHGMKIIGPSLKL
jgi:quercetin dioxygenase-like cupin family protein